MLLDVDPVMYTARDPLPPAGVEHDFNYLTSGKDTIGRFRRFFVDFALQNGFVLGYVADLYLSNVLAPHGRRYTGCPIAYLPCWRRLHFPFSGRSAASFPTGHCAGRTAVSVARRWLSLSSSLIRISL